MSTSSNVDRSGPDYRSRPPPFPQFLSSHFRCLQFSQEPPSSRLRWSAPLFQINSCRVRWDADADFGWGAEAVFLPRQLRREVYFFANERNNNILASFASSSLIFCSSQIELERLRLSGERECVWMCVRKCSFERDCVCVWVREVVCVWVYVYVWVRECVCVCECVCTYLFEREREREKERDRQIDEISWRDVLMKVNCYSFSPMINFPPISL